MAEKNILKADAGAFGTKSMNIDYPSNSDMGKKKVVKEEPEKKKTVKRVVSGGVKQKKKSLGKKFVETFVGEDIDSVGQYMIYDVLLPAARATVVEMVQGGIEVLLFGERKGSKTVRSGNRSYVSYNNYAGRKEEKKEDRRDYSSRNRSRHEFDDIVLTERGEAEEVISNLLDLIEDYGEATISDLYQLVGISGNFTDDKYGWKNLSTAYVNRVRDGYALNLPKAILL